MLDNLGKIPAVGDRFHYDNLDVEILKVDGRRAAEIRLRVEPRSDDEDEEDDD